MMQEIFTTQDFEEARTNEVSTTVLNELARKSFSYVMIEGMPWYLTPREDRPTQDYGSNRFILGSSVVSNLMDSCQSAELTYQLAHMVDDVHITKSSIAEYQIDALEQLSSMNGMTVRKGDLAVLESSYYEDGEPLCSNLDARFQLEKLWHLISNGIDRNQLGFIVVHPIEFQSQQNMMLQELSNLIMTEIDGFHDIADQLDLIRDYISNVYTHVWIDSDNNLIVTQPVFVDGHFTFKKITYGNL